MSKYEISDLAVDDLTDIWDYIADDSPRAANRQLAKIRDAFEHLGDMPGIGRRREELAPGLRSFPVGNYLIYYEPIEEGIRIKRVLHGARRAENLL